MIIKVVGIVSCCKRTKFIGCKITRFILIVFIYKFAK